MTLPSLVEAARAVAEDGLPESGVPLADDDLSKYVMVRVELMDALRSALSALPAAGGGCPKCHGLGYIPGTYERPECDLCHGHGAKEARDA